MCNIILAALREGILGILFCYDLIDQWHITFSSNALIPCKSFSSLFTYSRVPESLQCSKWSSTLFRYCIKLLPVVIGRILSWVSSNSLLLFDIIPLWLEIEVILLFESWDCDSSKSLCFSLGVQADVSEPDAFPMFNKPSLDGRCSCKVNWIIDINYVRGH